VLGQVSQFGPTLYNFHSLPDARSNWVVRRRHIPYDCVAATIWLPRPPSHEVRAEHCLGPTTSGRTVTPDRTATTNTSRAWMLARAEDFINDAPPFTSAPGTPGFRELNRAVSGVRYYH
jgi:hypothetical protein